MSEPTADVLGAPYTAETIELPADVEGDVVATLVKRPANAPTGKAVLHVHGFCDYFFQTGYAEWWTSRGYDFYALDLRKYGRSLRPHQTPNYVADLREYWPDLDAAWQRVAERDGHDHIVLSAHSTGGLTLPLWASERQAKIAGMMLNSPWFDLQGPAWQRTIGTQVIHRIAGLQPMRVMPRGVSGLYTQSLHADHAGEFTFNLDWKPVQSWPTRFGWISAIRRGHAELHAGLAISAPVLVLSSARSAWPTSMSEAVHTHDIVLDVQQIRRWAPAVGTHVTSIAIDGGRHDLSLSRQPVRTVFYDEIDRWRSAYVD